MADVSVFGKVQSASDMQRQKQALLLKQQLMALQRQQDREITPYQQEALQLQRQRMNQDAAMEQQRINMMEERLKAANQPATPPDINNPAVLAKLSATEQKAFKDTQDQLMSIDNALGAFGQIKEYENKPMYSGMGADVMASANAIPVIGGFIDDAKAANTKGYQNLVLQGQYAQLKSVFPGAISNAERQALENLGALATYAPEQRKEIIKNAESGLKRLRDIAAQRASDIATGQQYQKAVSPTMPAEMSANNQPKKRLRYNPQTGNLE